MRSNNTSSILKRLPILFQKIYPLVPFIVIILFTVFAYSNTFANGFVFDDKDFILNWQETRYLYNIPSLIFKGDLPDGQQGVYRPFRSLLYVISYRLWGLNPLGYHLQALLIHLICTLFVFLIGYELTKNKLISTAAAVLFGLNPLHTESITFLTTSFDTAGIIFFLMAFYLYIKAEESRRPLFVYLGVYINTFIAIMFYEMTFTLPILLVLYDISFKRLTLKNIKQRLIYYLPFILIAIIYALLRLNAIGFQSRLNLLGKTYISVYHGARIESPELIFDYLKQLIYPQPLYTYYSLPSHITQLYVPFYNKLRFSDPALANIIFYFDFLVPIATLSLLIGIILLIFQRYPAVSFSLSFMLLSYLPVMSIFPQGSIRNDKYNYLASVGFCIFLAFILYKLHILITKILKLKYLSSVIPAIFLSLCIMYTTFTLVRNREYKNEVSLWTREAYTQKDDIPAELLAKNNLDASYLEEKKFNQGIILSKQILKFAPYDSMTHLNLGTAYLDKHELNKAQKELLLSIKYDPTNYRAYASLGSLNLIKKNYNAAVIDLKKAIKLDYSNYSLHYNLYLAYQGLNKKKKAENEFKITEKLEFLD